MLQIIIDIKNKKDKVKVQNLSKIKVVKEKQTNYDDIIDELTKIKFLCVLAIITNNSRVLDELKAFTPKNPGLNEFKNLMIKNIKKVKNKINNIRINKNYNKNRQNNILNFNFWFNNKAKSFFNISMPNITNFLKSSLKVQKNTPTIKYEQKKSRTRQNNEVSYSEKNITRIIENKVKINSKGFVKKLIESREHKEKYTTKFYIDSIISNKNNGQNKNVNFSKSDNSYLYKNI